MPEDFTGYWKLRNGEVAHVIGHFEGKCFVGNVGPDFGNYQHPSLWDDKGNSVVGEEYDLVEKMVGEKWQ